MTRELIAETDSLSSEAISLQDTFPFPYTPENFSEEEREVLLRFFTNADGPVYAIKNLPQEVVGALFSRYSRSIKSARRVFLDEFWKAPELGIENIAQHLIDEGEEEGMHKAFERARTFYRRVFAEYGDDSVIQMGSPHIAFEFVSQIAAKAIEDQRIAAAYIEKSTRYVDFGSKVNGHFLFIEEPSIMGSEFADEFMAWNEAIFDTYNTHLPTVIEHFRAKFPIEEQAFEHSKTGEQFTIDEIDEGDERVKAERAYARALKAKSFDTIRVILPTTTVTNLGAHFSGQTTENALNKMLSSDHPEVRLLGLMAHKELIKVVPNFLQNVDHKYGERTRIYMRQTRESHTRVAEGWAHDIQELSSKSNVRLVDWDEEADVRIAAQIIYTGQKGHLSKQAIVEWAKKVKEEDIRQNPDSRWSPRLAEIIVSAVPDRSAKGLNRRHKLPRAFEHAFAEVDFNVDFGIYRDLQRNRMSSTERQDLSAEELYVPEEFYEPGLNQVRRVYERVAEQTMDLHAKLLASGDESLERAAEYVTILGNRLKFNVKANIRQWVFFSELRTIEGGHPTYRNAMQNATRQILNAMPFLETLFAHVDWRQDYGLGRLKAEVKTQEKFSDLEPPSN